MLTTQVDCDRLFAKRSNPLSSGGNAAPTPPTRQVLVRGRPVSAQETTRDFGGCTSWIEMARSSGQPSIRVRESDSLAEAGAKTQAPAESRGLEHGAPTTLGELGGKAGGTHQPSDLLHQLFARHHATGQRAGDRFSNLLQLFECDSVIFFPQCFLQVAPTGLEGTVP